MTEVLSTHANMCTTGEPSRSDQERTGMDTAICAAEEMRQRGALEA